MNLPNCCGQREVTQLLYSREDNRRAINHHVSGQKQTGKRPRQALCKGILALSSEARLLARHIHPDAISEQAGKPARCFVLHIATLSEGSSNRTHPSCWVRVPPHWIYALSSIPWSEKVAVTIRSLATLVDFQDTDSPFLTLSQT